MTAADTAVWPELERRMRELSDLSRIGAVLGWDQETYMPPRGAVARGRRIATLRGIAHERLVDPWLGEALRRAPEEVAGDPVREAMVRNLRRDRDRAVRLPLDFVRRLALSQSRGLALWKRARAADDFALLQPELETMIALKREEAALLDGDGEAYDALLEDYEPGMRVARLQPLLRALREDLVDLLATIRSAPPPPPPPWAGRRFDPNVQWGVTMVILADLGFDLEAGRQDRSAHPFTTSPALADVRVTTRMHDETPFPAIFSTIHEAGHGMYEQGFDPAVEDTPVHEPPSLGIHESQSRLWENVVGRSRGFWEHYTPLLHERFGDALAGAGVDDVYREVNRVQPSLIRVDADEVTYNLHILIRFELELALLRGELEVAELPRAWDDAYEAALGIRPPGAGDGVLQDIHWAQGSFGYFPTYTLGNLYSATLWTRLLADLPDADADVRAGRFDRILGWLREHVHRQGHLRDGEDLIREITGEGLRHEPFVAYLRAKFEPLYGGGGSRG